MNTSPDSTDMVPRRSKPGAGVDDEDVEPVSMAICCF